MFRKTAVLAPSVLAALSLVTAPAQAAPRQPFVAAWMMPMQSPGALAATVPFAADLGGRTVREVVRPTLTGGTVRVRLSNRLGSRPVTFTDVRIARSGDAGATSGPSRRLRFGGRRRVTVPAGSEVASAGVAFPVRAQRDVAVSFHASGPTGRVTSGGSLFHTSYVSDPGDVAGSGSPSRFPHVVRAGYFLTGLDVRPRATSGAVVVIGASITTGYLSTADAHRGWVDVLGRRLHARRRTRGLSMVNAGIAGNDLHEDTGCYGQSLLHRLRRDALRQPGVEAVVVALGSNDLTHPTQDPSDPCIAHTPISAAGMVAEYKRAVRRIQARHLQAILVTIPPFGGYRFWSAAIERKRLAINRWMRSTPLPDGVIDAQPVLEDPADPSRLRPAYAGPDGLHPNDAGHRALGEHIPLSMFRRP